MNYDLMLEYVSDFLESHNGKKASKPNQCFRDRFLHTKRVYGWAKRIITDYDDLDLDVVYTAVIFHDIGYALGKCDHASSSAALFIEYAKENGFDEEFTNKVADIISKHSNKKALNDPNCPHELVILLEADLLDEEGAMGVMWDLLSEGFDKCPSYDKAYECLNEHSMHILNQDYMITPLAKKYWEEKKEFARKFKDELYKDLFIGE